LRRAVAKLIAMPSTAADYEDVASPIDLQTMADARTWVATALKKRPAREEFFRCFVDELRELELAQPSVLELGSGPGFLARLVLEAIPAADYTMLDFSPAMHELAREHLGQLGYMVRQVEVDFKSPGWTTGLGAFNAVVTMQAVHEVRHKKHVAGLHVAVRSLLKANGRYLVGDHYVGPDGMRDRALHMTVEEQCDALRVAGFTSVRCVLRKDGLVLHSAAMDHGWARSLPVNRQSDAMSPTGRSRHSPPCSKMSGIWARADSSRAPLDPSKLPPNRS
jgi:SAM-dependent methyltransferase